jgi:hypothetical protein
LGMHLRRPTSQPPRYSSQPPVNQPPIEQAPRLSPKEAAKNRPALTRPD